MAAPPKPRTGKERWVVEPMRLEDTDRVRDIEKQSFSTPWPRQSYRHEIEDNRLAHYVVLRRDGPPRAPQDRDGGGLGTALKGVLGMGPKSPRHVEIAGFAGLWLMVDEAHITTLAVAPEWRGKGLGEVILLSLLDLSSELGANLVTLEVRMSNGIAQRLYEKYGFHTNGIRRHYYSDNGEDALVMWSEDLRGDSGKSRVEELRKRLSERLAWQIKL